MSEGWIKLHRSMLNWEWYDDNNTFKIFTHCLLRANHSDATWRGIQVSRGQFITSYASLAKETNLSVKQVRVSINKLKKTGEVASKSNSQHTVLTVINYDRWQGEGKQKGERGASEGQAKGKRGATDKNDKNDKNENKNTLSGEPDTATPSDDFLITQDKVENQPDPKPRKTKARPHKQAAESLIDYLNEKAGRNYEKVDSNLKLIESVLKVEGRTVELAKRVIDHKVAEWGSDPKMAQYLRPSTIFGKEKFSQYVGQLGANKVKSNQLDTWMHGEQINQQNTTNTIDGVFTHVN